MAMVDGKLVITWCAEDVQDKAAERGIKMTIEEAETFLMDNHNVLENAMVDFGWDAIASLL